MARVLIVDDMELNRRLVARLLETEGHQPTCAMDGAQALRMLPQADPDVILLDLVMPEMDGLTFLAEVSRRPQWAGIPVIVMSSLSDEQTRRAARMLGAKSYLIKAEFTADQMLSEVKRLAGEDHTLDRRIAEPVGRA